jgi:hypothetical protein
MMSHTNLNAELVSKRGIDWHIDHSLKIIIAVCDTLQNSNPEEYKKKFNFTKFVIFIVGFFPRGKVKSPKPFNNLEKISLIDLENQFKIASEKIQNIENLPAKANITHPIFGSLKRDETIKFLCMHTRHHYKIMKDIQNSFKKS